MATIRNTIKIIMTWWNMKYKIYTDSTKLERIFQFGEAYLPNKTQGEKFDQTFQHYCWNNLIFGWKHDDW
jgi:hypothetical protein